MPDFLLSDIENACVYRADVLRGNLKNKKQK